MFQRTCYLILFKCVEGNHGNAEQNTSVTATGHSSYWSFKLVSANLIWLAVSMDDSAVTYFKI